MATGYESDRYHDIAEIRKAVVSIAESLKAALVILEKAATPMVVMSPPDSSWFKTEDVRNNPVSVWWKPGTND